MRYVPLFGLVLLLSRAFTASPQDLIVDVNLRMLDVFVEDEEGNAVLDLSSEDFVVLEGGHVKPVTHLSLEAQPIALGLVVDRSSSIGPVKDKMDQAVVHLLKATRSDDSLFLMTFASTYKVSVTWTTAQRTIFEAVRKPKLGFGSRIYDALITLEYVSTSSVQQKALIVLSDGADHDSAHTIDQVRDVAAFYRIPIYIFGYVGDDSQTWSEKGRREIRNQLELLARMTGGKAFFSGNQTDCSKASKQIFERLRYHYRIGFYTSGPLTESSDVQVRLREEGSRRASVRNVLAIS